MGFPKNFLLGGATAANQLEGGVFEGGRGLANVDVCPSGADRSSVIAGHRKMLKMDDKHEYPAAEMCIRESSGSDQRNSGRHKYRR